MRALPAIGFTLTALLVAGCNASGWSSEFTAEQLPESAPVSNSVAVTLGPDSWPAASSHLTGELATVWPDGVTVDGSTVAVDLWDPGLSESHLEWDEGVIDVGVLTLSAGPEGLELQAEVSYDAFPVLVQTGSYGACPAEVNMEQGTVTAVLTLSATKLGRIQANPMAKVGWWSETMNVDLSACPPELRMAIEDSDGMGVFHQALSEHTIAALSPWLASAVPSTLGLGLATAARTEYSGDGTGTGSVRWALQAPSTETGVGSHYADGQLVVPFGLAMDVETHPCVPSFEFSGPSGSGLPSVTDERAVIVNQDTLRRALRASWAAGAYCNRRITEGISWTVDELSPVWEELSGLGGTSLVQLRLWPEEAPSLVAQDGDSGVEVLLDGGLWTLELMGEREGAVVRLATLRMRLEITSDLDIAGDGSMWLSPTATDVVALGATDGLLGAPDLEMAQALAGPLAERLVATSPVGWLPSLPGYGDVRVRLSGAHLVFFSQD